MKLPKFIGLLKREKILNDKIQPKNQFGCTGAILILFQHAKLAIIPELKLHGFARLIRGY